MDKTDLAIAIATLSAAFTGLQWVTSRAIHRLQLKQARRPDPIFELRTRPVPGYPGWHEVDVLIRNNAHVTVHVSAVHVARFRRARLFDHGSAMTRDADGQLRLQSPPPFARGVRSLALDISLGPETDAPEPGRRGIFSHEAVRRLVKAGTTGVTLLVHGPVAPLVLRWDWVWADGHVSS